MVKKSVRRGGEGRGVKKSQVGRGGRVVGSDKLKHLSSFGTGSKTVHLLECILNRGARGSETNNSEVIERVNINRLNDSWLGLAFRGKGGGVEGERA